MGNEHRRHNNCRDEECGAQRARADADTYLALGDSIQEVDDAPHAEHPPIDIAQNARIDNASTAIIARMAATRSPYADGIEKAGGSDGDTTPGTRKLSPMNRNE